MRIDRKRRIKSYYAEGFSVSELSIMYSVSQHTIELVLEEDDEL